MEIIWVLFIFIVIFFKTLPDNLSNTERKIARTEDEQRLADWKEKVVDTDLEAELKAFIANKDNAQAVSDEVSEVFDKILKEVFYPEDRGWDELERRVCRIDEKNILRIMMAKRGKMPLRDAMDSWKCTKEAERAAKRGEPDNPSNGIRVPRTQTAVCTWCTWELRKHDLRSRFVVKKGESDRDKKYDYIFWRVP